MVILRELKLKWLEKSSRPKLVISTFLFLIFIYVFSAVFLGVVRCPVSTPDPTWLLVDRHYKFVAELEKEKSDFGYWPLPDTIPEKILSITVAAEDKRFYSHFGIDLKSIGRALYTNYITHEAYSGASTIAMQCARLKNPGKRRWHKKISESVSAILKTVFYGREKVLRQYLKIAPYGNRIRGVNYAARRYFKKPIKDLSYAEIAILAAIPRAPGRFNVFRDIGFRKAKKRAYYILDRAKEYNFIDSVTYKDACNELSYMKLPKKEIRSEYTLHAILAIEKYLKQNPVTSLDPYNPTIRLALDLDLQEDVQQAVFKEMSKLRPFDCTNCAVLVLDKEKGQVLSYIGNELYSDELSAGNIDFIQTPRSTGSLLKPFIYASGIEYNGFNESTILTDVGLHFGDKENPYLTQNYDNEFIGPVLYKTALANSRNIPAVQVTKDVGIHKIYDNLSRLNVITGEVTADHYGLGMALGNVYTTLFRLCQGYLSLANKGDLYNLNFLYSDSSKVKERIFSPDIATHIQHMLSDPQARLPSFPRGGFLEYRYAVAIKTGTSRGFRDAWSIGWSDKYMVGVWLGKHDNESTKRLSGYGAAAPFVKSIFNILHPERNDGLSNISFKPPGSYKSCRISTLSGELAADDFPYATEAYFKPGTEPVKFGSPFKIIAIDKRNGLLASPLCKRKFVEFKRFITMPPLFKDWALREGLPVPPVKYSDLCGEWTNATDYKVTITNPADGAQLYIDPEMPADKSCLILNCIVKPESESVLWIIDGVEAGVSSYPYRLKWKITPGIHTFQAQVPYSNFTSPLITIKVL